MGNIEVSVRVFAFDLLFIDAACIINLPFRERRRILHEAFSCTNMFTFADFVDVDAIGAKTVPAESAKAHPVPETDPRHDRVQEALEKALAENCEGLMCKSLDAPYEPSDGSKRSTAWLKLKADYIEGMGDSMDLVPIAGWQGMGRKAKWISPFLLACWDPATESLQSVCRVLSGFTDAFYREKTAFYLGDEAHVLGEGMSDDHDTNHADQEQDMEGCEGAATEKLPQRRTLADPRVVTGEAPPHWFEPCEVWEVKGANLSLSPKHKAGVGLVHPERGLSLRFPRFIRLRPDKRIEDATTSEQMVEMFRRQQMRGADQEHSKMQPVASDGEDENE